MPSTTIIPMKVSDTNSSFWFIGVHMLGSHGHLCVQGSNLRRPAADFGPMATWSRSAGPTGPAARPAFVRVGGLGFRV